MAGFEVIIYGRFWVIAEDNILAFHLTLAPASIPPALVAPVLWVLVFLQYRASFKDVLTATPAPGTASR
jgi:hypothetical protein